MGFEWWMQSFGGMGEPDRGGAERRRIGSSQDDAGWAAVWLDCEALR